MNIWDDEWGEQGDGPAEEVAGSAWSQVVRYWARRCMNSTAATSRFTTRITAQRSFSSCCAGGRRCRHLTASVSSRRAKSCISRQGREGAHGLRNDTDEPVRYVIAGTRASPEVVEYPDLNKVTGQSMHGIFFIHDMEKDEPSPHHDLVLRTPKTRARALRSGGAHEDGVPPRAGPNAPTLREGEGVTT